MLYMFEWTTDSLMALFASVDKYIFIRNTTQNIKNYYYATLLNNACRGNKILHTLRYYSFVGGNQIYSTKNKIADVNTELNRIQQIKKSADICVADSVEEMTAT